MPTRIATPDLVYFGSHSTTWGNSTVNAMVKKKTAGVTRAFLETRSPF